MSPKVNFSMKKKESEYPKEFLEYIKLIKNKRAKIVIDHIIQNGYITTEELEKKYNYKHAPRAARDVRETGIPLITYSIKSEDQKSIAAYKFGDLSKLQRSRIGGRVVFPKEFKTKLYSSAKHKCQICNGDFEERYLQVDHRVPYEVAGDTSHAERNIKDFMLLCGSCNRVKSWSCEHCGNWHEDKNEDACLSCYWGNPDNYNHIALNNIRRIDVQWSNEEVDFYDQLKDVASKNKISLPEMIKKIISKMETKK